MTNTPYLSVVATARNDNHGGNMLRRMQIFINGLLEQSRRYQLETELILVEWNPPTDKPRLAEALSWQVENSPCIVRIIEVPPDVHRQFNHSVALPLFQMIAKNVGIRRAQGEFVLATNIDLLFSNELFGFLASRQLQAGKMYRLDRYDVRSDVPLEAPLEQQLDYCKHNLLRINRRDHMEYIQVEEVAIAPEAPEILEVVEVVEDENRDGEIEAIVPASPGWQDKIPDAALPALTKLRKLYKRLLPTAVKDKILSQLPPDAIDWLIRQQLLTVKQPPLLPEPIEPDPPTEATEAAKETEATEATEATEETEAPEAPKEAEPPVPPHPPLHTNACGDFTLLAKTDWLALRGYAEFEMYSFHIDSVFCYTAAYAGIEEVILEDPLRMYHIEHGGGWTPETEEDLDQRLAARKIPKMTYEQLIAIMDVLKLQRQGKRTFANIFNDDNWGLASETLPEISPIALTQVVGNR